LREVKEEVLYQELLAATAVVSDARQRIFTLRKSGYARSHWLELGMIFIIFAAIVIASASSELVSRLAAGAILSSGSLLVLTFLEHDLLTKESDRKLSMEYIKNIARLELRRG
jgi:hypothetical protein